MTQSTTNPHAQTNHVNMEPYGRIPMLTPNLHGFVMNIQMVKLRQNRRCTQEIFDEG
jgi:hypothetical protein